MVKRVRYKFFKKQKDLTKAAIRKVYGAAKDKSKLPKPTTRQLGK